jgi:hypothetical protein
VPGPDLPPADEFIDVETWLHRWPSGAEKVELMDGSLAFQGVFDERDAVLARRTYPGRVVEIDTDGGLWVHPSTGPTQRLRELLDDAEGDDLS